MKTRILAVGILAVALAVGLLAPATAQSPVSEFDTILADRVVATDSMTAPDVTVSDDLAVTDAATVGGALAVTGNASMAGTLAVIGDVAFTADVVLPAQATQTVTTSATFTPTGALQRITAVGSATPVLGSGSDGQVVILLNTGAQAITLADTTGQTLAGNWVGGQWDTLTLVWYGTGWFELTRANN